MSYGSAKASIRTAAECWFCGGRLEGDIGPMRRTVEHLTALHIGGDSLPGNVVPAHAACNEMAGSLSPNEKSSLRVILLRRGMPRTATERHAALAELLDQIEPGTESAEALWLMKSRRIARVGEKMREARALEQEPAS
jgi:hypothetical protein